ncbi:MAG: hypothetical protein ACKPKO_18355, partial [Candidatus Fonsibacter sp.]
LARFAAWMPESALVRYNSESASSRGDALAAAAPSLFVDLLGDLLLAYCLVEGSVGKRPTLLR